MSAKDIFPEIVRAIKTHDPELLIRDLLDQKEFERILKRLRDDANFYERYHFR